jgi:hypothetical protein
VGLFFFHQEKSYTRIASNMALPSKPKSLAEKISELENATPKGICTTLTSSARTYSDTDLDPEDDLDFDEEENESRSEELESDHGREHYEQVS